MRLFVLAVGLAAVTPVFAFAQQDTEAQVARIRASYAAVQNGLDGFEQAEKVYYFGDGEGLITTHSDGSGMRKLVVLFERDGFTGQSEYFFEAGDLFFAFTKGETFQTWPDQDPSEFGVTENRYYFADEALVRWLVKSHTENMRQRTVPPGHEDYPAEGGRVMEDAHTWSDYARSEIEDYEAFLDSRRNR